ncbi:MAG TPA: hypothetical protein VFI25_05190 [Planctomycetota bacterium]|nr:hypothetical protein [Planctomycetota bacterium]
MIPLAAAALAAAVSFAATPLVRRLALRAGVLDRPGGRKWHDAPVPRLGGLAILGGIALPLLLASASAPAGRALGPSEASLLVLLLSGVCALGAIDDFHGLRARHKVALEVLLGLAAWGCGYQIRAVHLPGVGTIAFGPLAIPVTVLWIVGVTNALNLIDGMDGLASGVAAISAGACAAVASRAGAEDAALLFGVVAGAAIGFFPHNRPPARVFLGDSGSLLLGFSLALFSVRGACKGAVLVSLLAPAVALGLPLADAALAFSRRVRGGRGGFRGFSPARLLRGIAAAALPDADHIHHRLARAGLTRREAVTTLHAICLALGLAAFAATLRRDAGAAAILFYAAATSVLGIRVLSRAAAPRRGRLRGDARRERTVLVVHPDGEVSAAVRREAEALGLRTIETAGSEEAAALARERSFDLVVAGGEGAPEEVGGLERLRGAFPNAVLVAVSGCADAESALGTLERGAYDVLDLPAAPGRTRLVLARALERVALASRFRVAASLLWLLLLVAPILVYVVAVLG